jgi:tetratricopeptide (TPR) repeat protein
MPEALTWYRRALELDPLSVTISNGLAQTLLALGQDEEAARQYARSREIDPDFVPTYAHMAQLERFVNGRPDEAVGLLFEAYRRDPAHSEYPALMAEALLELDAPEAAGRWAERAVSNAPDHWWPARAAVLVALNSGDPAALEEALDANGPVLGNAWLALVSRRDLLIRAGELDAARELFLDAVPDFFLDPPQVDANNFYIAPALAEVHRSRGEEERRRALLERTLAVLDELRREGYDDFDISEVEARAMLGQTEQALDLLEAHVEHDWLDLWWYVFDGPQLSALAGEPRFETLAERIRERMHALRDNLDPVYLAPPAVGESPAAVEPAAVTAGSSASNT